MRDKRLGRLPLIVAAVDRQRAGAAMAPPAEGPA